MGGVRWVREAVGLDRAAARSVRQAVSAWRALIADCGGAGQRTLLACSGGADSSALALALASAGTELVVGHVVHDLRVPAEALADRDAAKALARRLGLPFVEASIAVRARPGNAENNARRHRYAALVGLARAHSCPFVATGHHADDQMETVLMRLLRGAGPRGLGGMARRRALARAGPGSGADVWLLRPMLALSRPQAQRICTACGVAWRVDRTNLDTSRLRAAIRHELAPAMRRIAPAASRHFAVAAELMAQAAELCREEALAVLARADRAPHEIRWARGLLRTHREVVLGDLLALAAFELRGERGADRLTHAAVLPALRAMRDARTQPREFEFGGVRVLVDAHRVAIRAHAAPDGDAGL